MKLTNRPPENDSKLSNISSFREELALETQTPSTSYDSDHKS